MKFIGWMGAAQVFVGVWLVWLTCLIPNTSTEFKLTVAMSATFNIVTGGVLVAAVLDDEYL